MATVHDIAVYILEKAGPMTAMKLQKLVYYSQAWSLVWDEKPLFPNRIEAWANGPVVPSLYQLHRGQFKVSSWSRGNASSLAPEEQETVDAVLDYYGHRSSQWLSELTHQEDPWREARDGLAPGQRGNSLISEAAMAEYYGSLV
ncbi:MAG: type II toxin-antitoxin system antitoxin SocA domain-containing protein [Acidobacteriota bacterium]